MPEHRLPIRTRLAHHRLVAYEVAVQLLITVRETEIRDPKLREQALRAAKSACLNVAEASGRVSVADKALVFAIARGECVEAAAAVEIAALSDDAPVEEADRVLAIAERLYGLLTGLIR
jgi:four helix bundle protein